MDEIGDIVSLNGVLIKSAARAATDTEILYRLQESRGHGQLVQLGTKAIDNVCCPDFALVQRLERNVNESSIAGPIAAGIGVYVRNCGIGFDHLH
jgi:hypothetical protein